MPEIQRISLCSTKVMIGFNEITRINEIRKAYWPSCNLIELSKRKIIKTKIKYKN